MNTISFMSANYVARQLGYNMTGGWGQGDRASNEYFRPIETFPERFEEMLLEITDLGFTAIDLWLAHLNPAWATAEHVASARDLLAKFGLPVVSLAGGFGATPEEFAATCRLAVELGAPLLGGRTPLLEKDRQAVISLLKQHGLKLGVENHPEKTPADLLAQIGDDGGGTIGACVDTGWFATQGYDAAAAIEELRDVLFHVHLKDVLAAGAHDTCGYGKGVVPIERCARTLQRIGYAGAISVEHEPEHYSPNDDCVAALALLDGWLR
jgi:sugar phosphate isomerase/epimerase